MEISCPTNWDDALLDAIAGLPVTELYGKTDGGPIGGGRPRFILGRIPAERAAAHIRKVRERGLGFTYLLNAPCAGNLEYGAAVRRELVDHLRWARDAGADCVTVTIPLLVELVKREVPELRVKVSVIAAVGSVPRARQVEALGADEITVDWNVNRDLALLGRIRAAVRCELSLLANDLCLLQCPFRAYHYNLVGHASCDHDASDGFVIDYCFFKCHGIKVTRPVELLKAPWIRPDDVPRYEALGFRKFKVAGRSKETGQIVAAVRAYAARRFDGNLLDILEGTTRDTSTLKFAVLRSAVARTPGLLGRLLPLLARVPDGAPLADAGNFADLCARVPREALPILLRAYVELMQMGDAIRIDNRALDGFLDGFARRHCAEECADCDWCDRWAERAVQVDRDKADAIARAVAAVLDGVVSGRSLPGGGGRAR